MADDAHIAGRGVATDGREFEMKTILSGGAVIELGDGYTVCHDIDIASRLDRYHITTCTSDDEGFEIRVAWYTPDWEILGKAFDPKNFPIGKFIADH